MPIIVRTTLGLMNDKVEIVLVLIVFRSGFVFFCSVLFRSCFVFITK